jgi:hypothetical protein
MAAMSARSLSRESNAAGLSFADTEDKGKLLLL